MWKLGWASRGRLGAVLLFAALLFSCLLILAIAAPDAPALTTEAWVVEPVTADGQEKQALVFADDLLCWAASDGTDTEIWLHSLETGETSRLTDNQVPDVGPQMWEAWVAWVSEEPSGKELWLTRAATQDGRMIAGPEDGFAGLFSLADGRLAYVAGTPGSQEIYVWDLASASERNVTADGGDKTEVVQGGDFLCYIRTYVTADGYDNLTGDVYEVNLTTGARRRLTENSQWEYDLSLGGDLVAWTRHFLSSEPYVDAAVVVGCHLGDGEPQQLTPIDGYYAEPLVLDGRILCSVGRSRIMSTLAVYDWATHELTDLPATAIADLQARGNLAVWETAQKYAPGDVRAIDVATGDTWQLTDSPWTFEHNPGTDGERVAWIDERFGVGQARGPEVYLATRRTVEVAFPDILGAPYWPAISALKEAGVVTGRGDGTYGPDDPLVRAQFAKMLVCGLGIDVAQWGSFLRFSDVERNPDDLYPDDYVAAATAFGLVKGTSRTTFAPYQPVTRAQVLAMAARAGDRFLPGGLRTPVEGKHTFHYLNWYEPTFGDQFAQAEGAGLLSWIALEDWDVWQPATRGEAAQVVANLRKLIDLADAGWMVDADR